MTDSEAVEKKDEAIVEPVAPVMSEKTDRKKVFGRATSLAYSATLIIVLGLLDQLHARVFCLSNTGVTILRMVFFLTAITLVLTSIGMVIQSKRWRVYYGIGAFFVGFLVVMQPTYYTSMRTDVGQYRCIWSGKTDSKVSL